MPGVKGLYEGLGPTDRELFIALVTDLAGSSRPEKINRLKEFLSELRTEIDEINRRRHALGAQLDNVAAVRRLAEQSLALKGDKLDLELELFKDQLVATEESLKQEIADTRPDRKLEKKMDVSRRISALQARAALADTLQVTVLGKAMNPKVGDVDVRLRSEEMVDRRKESNKEIESKVKDLTGRKVLSSPDPLVTDEDDDAD